MSLTNVEEMDVGSVAGSSTDSGKERKPKNISVSVGGFYGKPRGNVVVDDINPM